MNRRNVLAVGGGAAGLAAVSRTSAGALPSTAVDATPSAGSDIITVRTAQELTDAISRFAPGDEVVISDGVYEDVELEIDVDGRAPSPIRICAESPYGAVFTGTTQVRVSGSYIEISGLRFANSEEVPQYGVFNLWGAAHCRITSCEFEDLEGMWGTVVVHYGPDDNRVDHNHFCGLPASRSADRRPRRGLGAWAAHSKPHRPQHHQRHSGIRRTETTA